MTAAAAAVSHAVGGRTFRVVFAPDSFKGSLSSLEVARALAAGWRRARPDDELLLAPLADGGEGTLVAVEAAGGWDTREAAAHDPIGRPITARWLQSSDGRRAVVELASASGLSRLTPSEYAPLTASTRGTGEVLLAALDAGVRHVVVGIGGSATNDGGTGLLEALGARDDGATISLDGLDRRLTEVEMRIACDVTNPLLGPQGAAATYGPQKGASPDQVEELDRRLTGWADRLEAATGRRERDTPGAGAAGGVGFGLLTLSDRFRSLRLEPGVELVMDETDLDSKLRTAEIVVTGEGRVDKQTGYGKTALGVARRAAAARVACICVGGGVAPEGIEALEPLGVVVVPVVERPQSVEDAMAAGREPVERCGERVARLISIGSRGENASPEVGVASGTARGRHD